MAGWSFAASALAWFLLYEPAAVLLGLRGERVRQAAGTRARRYAGGLALVGAGLGAVALLLGSSPARLASLVPIGLALLLIPVVRRRRQKTLGAELLVVAALTSTLLPVAAAGAVGWRLVGMALAVWLVSFVLITLLVHAVKARHKQVHEKRWIVWAAPLLAGLTVAGALALMVAEAVPVAVGLAFLPAALFSLIVVLLRVRPARLRVVGWSVVGANALTLALLLQV